jgi:protein PhnA
MSDESGNETRDSNGTILADGDNVTVIKDLKVKGTSSTIKRGTLVKSIRLTGNPDEVECRVEKIKGLVLRTEFLKKA